MAGACVWGILFMMFLHDRLRVTAANSSLPAFQWCHSHLSHPSTNTYSRSTNTRKNKLLKYCMEWSRESPEKSSSAAFCWAKITYRGQRVEYLLRPQWRDLILLYSCLRSVKEGGLKHQVGREVWTGPNVHVRQLTTENGAGAGGNKGQEQWKPDRLSASLSDTPAWSRSKHWHPPGFLNLFTSNFYTS